MSLNMINIMYKVKWAGHIMISIDTKLIIFILIENMEYVNDIWVEAMYSYDVTFYWAEKTQSLSSFFESLNRGSNHYYSS